MLVQHSNPDSELVLGLVAATGTDLKLFEKALSNVLKSFDYKPNVIKLIDAVNDNRINEQLGITIDKRSEYDRLDSSMKAGNKIREVTGHSDFFSRWAVTAIAQERDYKDSKQDRKFSRTAHILHSLKRPEEAKRLRAIYTSGFYLVGVFCDAEQRIHSLRDRGMSLEEARKLIERDQNEQEVFGQRTRDTFHLADVFINLNLFDFDQTKREIERFLDLIFGCPFITPTQDEHSMFLAFASSLRSASLARQVGAVIASANGELIATGANDTPRAGGGQYRPGAPDKRDHIYGIDSNTKKRNEIIVDVVKRFTNDNSLGFQELLDLGLEKLKGSSLLDITEFARDVHAEMEAISSCARVGVSTQDATLYTTTFPCHNCAKHIIAAGIKRVVYVEPYPKSLAEELHGDAIVAGRQSDLIASGKVWFEPFIGVGPRRYFDLFSLSISDGYEIERKNKDGKKVEWERAEAKLRTPLLPTSYFEREILSLYNLSELITTNQGESRNVKKTRSRSKSVGVHRKKNTRSK